jgi:hypothetical protein
MRAVADHLAHHRLHLVACGVAAVLVVVAIVSGPPSLALLGGLACAAMMIGMVWMMVSMGSRHHH